MPSLTLLNALSPEAFVETLGGVFEHSPWVAQRAALARPFGSLDDLHRALCAVVAAAGPEAQLALIRAHPDLAGRTARAGELTASSSAEQAGAGLGSLSEEEYRRFHELNDRYRARFDFPFILAVKGHSKASILAAFAARLPNTPDAERALALEEIYRIARFRLEALTGVAP